jgi:hypothetical protein
VGKFGSFGIIWAVTWYGSQTKFGVTFDYHINVVNAFETVPALKNFINSNITGDISIIAHSLGNMVVSSLLSDNSSLWDTNDKAIYPVARIKNYFMIDAAVAIETYDGIAAKSMDMVSSDWNGYAPNLWSTEWYRLFKDQPLDGRSKLTWRDRFKNRPASTRYVNFFSSGEEVLSANPYDTPLSVSLWKVTSPFGNGTWALQEKLKGSYPGIDFVGNSSGGWGFNCLDKEYCIGGETPIPSTIANLLDGNVLKIKPFFRKSSNGDLYEPGDTGSTYAFNNMNHLLAEAMPALTLPIGANIVEIFTGNNTNYNMQEQFKNDKKDWPQSRGLDKNWHHSDVIEVAYPYVYSLFDTLNMQGGLGK